jgi:hypothetical protein
MGTPQALHIYAVTRLQSVEMHFFWWHRFTPPPLDCLADIFTGQWGLEQSPW